MKINYYENEKLPKLAWCALIQKDNFVIHVYHGPGVETFDEFFVEGAWDGEFYKGEFYKSYFFLGTGGRIIKDGLNKGILFSTPNHTLERLYSINEPEKIFVSNSLPFILYMSGTELDDKYLHYETDLNSILKGVNEYKKIIPLRNNRELNLHYFCNIFIDSNLDYKIFEKNSVKPFKNYDDYYVKLITTLKLIVSNAQSKERKFHYGLVSTISKGYDAAACAAVALELGCRTVVTFNEPEKYADDNGECIAQKLGYKNIVKKNANQYLENNSFIEAEFLSSGELGTGIVFTSFEEEFKQNIVFMGERGDKIWDKNRTDANKEMRFENELYPGTSMTENRLKVGYILLPMPLFGATQWPSIHEISNSKEMEDFSIGGEYDRPIPRRIVETKGVERTMFGMKKIGAGLNYRFDNLNRIKKECL